MGDESEKSFQLKIHEKFFSDFRFNFRENLFQLPGRLNAIKTDEQGRRVDGPLRLVNLGLNVAESGKFSRALLPSKSPAGSAGAYWSSLRFLAVAVSGESLEKSSTNENSNIRNKSQRRFDGFDIKNKRFLPARIRWEKFPGEKKTKFSFFLFPF